LAAPIFAGAFRPFGFFAVSDFIRSGFLSIPASDFVGVLRGAFSAAPRRGHYFSEFPWRLIIESAGSIFGNAKADPSGSRAK
ncbi:hypothetical protein, partial [Streptomyces sp. N2A]|uniref:hypothetical protein n=1 Tax=Streptomyces sp. N2A TaxID=3073936 RepID=UPI0028707A1C